jgi:NAD(P)-dependent dehydrogenase (short-subunit alcohol dehydrogenase family)
VRLKDRVAIITGSTAGIGRATALLFAQEGARIVVNGRSAERGQEVVEQIEGAGGEATFVQADLGQKGEVERVVDCALEKYGRIDVMMNNAYSTEWGSVLEVDEDGWDRSLDVMLKAVYLGCRLAVPHMIRQGGGSIINVSSVHGYLAARKSAPYEAAKAAIINLTRQVAVDFGPNNIRANSICPGAIAVEKTLQILAEHPEYVPLAGLVYPLRRIGLPVEVANVALFLASDESSFVTGHALVVDGGMTVQLQDTLVDTFDAYYRETLAKEWGVNQK